MSVMDKKLYLKDTSGTQTACSIYSTAEEVGDDYLTLYIDGNPGYVKLGDILNPNATLGRVLKGDTTYAIWKEAIMGNKYFGFNIVQNLAYNRYTRGAESVSYPSIDASNGGEIIDFVCPSDGYVYARHAPSTGSMNIIRSKDLKSWETVYTDTNATYDEPWLVCIDDKLMYGRSSSNALESGKGNFVYSEDGVTWNNASVPALGGYASYRVLYYNGEYYTFKANYNTIGTDKGITTPTLETFSTMYKTSAPLTPNSSWTDTGITPAITFTATSNNKGTVLVYAKSSSSLTIWDSTGTHDISISEASQAAIFKNSQIFIKNPSYHFLYKDGSRTQVSLPSSIDPVVLRFRTDLVEEFLILEVYDSNNPSSVLSMFITEDCVNYTQIF